MGDGAGGDTGRGVARHQDLAAIHQGRAEPGIEQNGLLDALRRQGAGEFGGSSDISGRAQGEPAVGHQREEGAAARVFSVVDVEPVEPGTIGGDTLVDQPDPPQKSVRQARERGGQSRLIRHRFRVIGEDAGPAWRQQHKRPARKRLGVVLPVEYGLRLVAAQRRPDQDVVGPRDPRVREEGPIHPRLRPGLSHQTVHAAAQDGPARLRHPPLNQDERDTLLAVLGDEEGRLWVDHVNAAGRQGHGGRGGRNRCRGGMWAAGGRRGHKKGDCQCSRA